MLEVGAALERGEGDVARVGVGAEVGDDGGAEFLEDLRVTQELVEEPGEQRGGGVAAGEEDVEELGAEFDGVAGARGELFEEDVALLVVAFFGELLATGGFAQGQVYVVVNEALDVLVVVFELARVVQPVEISQAETLGKVGLSTVEVAGEGRFPKEINISVWVSL